jgi:hypothetical protein
VVRPSDIGFEDPIGPSVLPNFGFYLSSDDFASNAVTVGTFQTLTGIIFLPLGPNALEAEPFAISRFTASQVTAPVPGAVL